MKKYFWILFLFAAFFSSSASAATWSAQTPEGFSPITWVSEKSIASFYRAPEGPGYSDYVTIIYLPTAEVKLFSSSTPREITSDALPPFPKDVAQNWLFTRATTETFKAAHPEVRFLWNMPFFSVSTTTTNLSFGLKSSDNGGTYITSGYRIPDDIIEARRMLVIDNKSGTGMVSDFDETIFVGEGDQAVEGFHPFSGPSAKSAQAARLYVGVRAGGTELVIYCSRSASGEEASAVLVSAGVPVEHQMQADGGGSAMCGYNLPGQYFVEPGRELPHVMGAIPFVFRGKIKTDKLNVRSGAGTANSVVRQVALDTPVTVYEEKNGWVRIGEGEWVSQAHVQKVRLFPYSAKVTIPEVNVRDGAGVSFAVVRRLPIATKISVREEKNGWVKIADGEWVSAKYIAE